LTVRLISRAGTQVGLSDPVVPNGWAIAQEIKVSIICSVIVVCCSHYDRNII